MAYEKDKKDNILNYEHVAVEAKQLVDEVIEEACGIVNTANDSHDPWKFISCLKNYQDDTYNQNLTFVINKDCLRNLKLDNSIVTSTPQRGQGDVEVKLANENNTFNSTSLYISQLFNMTEVVVAEEELVNKQIEESDVSIVEDITEMIDHCVNTSVYKVYISERHENSNKQLIKKYTDDSRQLNLFEDVIEVNEMKESNTHNEIHKVDVTKKYVEATDRKRNENICLEDLCSYENAYLSLNRDEPHFDLSEFKLQDPRKLTLQEVDLTPEQDDVKKVGQENLEVPTSSKNAKPLTDLRKRTLVYRCRLQSRKILARLRSWLWRRSVRKYKVSRGWTGAEGMSPLPPSAKRRAASLNHWQIRGTFSHSAWKFNTIGEAFVNSALWKELGTRVQFKRSY